MALPIGGLDLLAVSKTGLLWGRRADKTSAPSSYLLLLNVPFPRPSLHYRAHPLFSPLILAFLLNGEKGGWE
jgi:hypothetical protein